jgi:hypothetical protein
MDLTAIIALLNAAATLLPEIEKIVPIANAIISGQTVTSAQAAQLWTVIANLESIAAAKAAQIENPAAP